MAPDAPAVGFAVLPNFIARDGSIEPALKTLLLALSSYAGADQTCFPSNGTLQTCTGLSERTVRDWLREGERRGYVVTHRRTDPATGAPTSNLYELNFAKWSNPLARQNLHGVSENSAGGWGGVSPQVGQPVAPGWGGVSPPNKTSEQDQGTKPDQHTPAPAAPAPSGLLVDVPVVAKNEITDDKPKAYSAKAQALIDGYHEHCPSLPKCQAKPGGATAKAIAAALKRDPDLDGWRQRFQRAEYSEFLTGRKTDFKANLLWLLNATNADKIDNGNFDGKTPWTPPPKLDPEWKRLGYADEEDMLWDQRQSVRDRVADAFGSAPPPDDDEQPEPSEVNW